MNRKERRRTEKETNRQNRQAAKFAEQQLVRDIKRDGVFDSAAALNNPHYMEQVRLRRLAQREKWAQNGITKADLDAAYQEGYSAAKKNLTGFTMRMFYAAIGISLHRLFRFGENRIIRVLDDVQQIMTEEICTDDIIARLKAETGVDVITDGYDN